MLRRMWTIIYMDIQKNEPVFADTSFYVATSMCQIEFHQAEIMRGKIPNPYPASRHIPEWFKNMPAESEIGDTLKRCPPFLEAMTAGYIIPAPGDLLLSMTYTGLTVEGKYEFLSLHRPAEYRGSPLQGNIVAKFHNPWIIVTPPEYVCLITAPINRFEIPFMPLTGIVETGTYYKEVQLPIVCLMRPGDRFMLPCGAPMIHVIPFRREEWTSRTDNIDLAHRNEQQAKFDINKHTYKDEFWKKMHFS
jgi:uncharacterized protein DUF6065